MIDGAHLILLKNSKRDEVFLVRRSDYPLWVDTGGGIEKGEKPKEAAVREAVEETGFKVKSLKLLSIYKVVNKDGQKVGNEYVYEGRVVSGQYKPEFSGCKGKWFQINKLPFNISKSSKRRIFDLKKHRGNTATKFKRKQVTPWDYNHFFVLFPLSTLKFFIKKLKKD